MLGTCMAITCLMLQQPHVVGTAATSVTQARGLRYRESEHLAQGPRPGKRQSWDASRESCRCGVFFRRGRSCSEVSGGCGGPQTPAQGTQGATDARGPPVINNVPTWGAFENLIRTVDRLPKVPDYTHTHTHTRTHAHKSNLFTGTRGAMWHGWLLSPGDAESTVNRGESPPLLSSDHGNAREKTICFLLTLSFSRSPLVPPGASASQPSKRGGG